jgi:thiamine biosynthesis protein ThiI
VYHTLLVNVDELWLKGENRRVYKKALRIHIKELLKKKLDLTYEFSDINHRYILEREAGFTKEHLEHLLKIPGIHSIIPARKIALDRSLIIPAVLEEVRKAGLTGSFKVNTDRKEKRFPVKSMELSREVGHFILKEFPELSVKMKNPDHIVEIRILRDGIFISTQKFLGVGGLPVGPSGHLITMLSGGLDSPVASYLMSKRGCRQTFIFFYAYPFVGDEVKDKILDLISPIARYQKHCKLYIIPFGKIQQSIADNCWPEYRTVLFSWYMLQCATVLAQKVGGQAIVTGDALGQVSSQTLDNLSALSPATPLPILRPLIGFNKSEIVDLAKQIGTFDISIIPHDDACSLLAPQNPILKAKVDYISQITTQHDLSSELTNAVESSDVYSIDVLGRVTQVSSFTR